MAKVYQGSAKTMGNDHLVDEPKDKDSDSGDHQSIDDDNKKFGRKILGPQIARTLESFIEGHQSRHNHHTDDD
jgi:hypothetical protein